MASDSGVIRILTSPWVLLLCCAMCGPLKAIDRDRRLDQLYHTAWTAKDGAPTFVRACAQTPDGFLWFGGPNGLYRFDGAKFARYEELYGASLPNTGVSALLGLPDGSLLIGWISGGVNLLKDGQFKNYVEPGSGFPANATVDRLQKGGDGSIWAMLTSGDVFRVEGRGHWRRVGAELPDPRRDHPMFYADRQGTLWWGTEKQVFCLRPGQTRFHEISGGTSVTQSPDGALWLRNHNSIRSMDYEAAGAEIWTAPGHDDGEVLFGDSEGSLWFKVDGKGILRIPHPENRSPQQKTSACLMIVRLLSI